MHHRYPNEGTPTPKTTWAQIFTASQHCCPTCLKPQKNQDVISPTVMLSQYWAKTPRKESVGTELNKFIINALYQQTPYAGTNQSATISFKRI